MRVNNELFYGINSKKISLSYRDEALIQEINNDRERWMRVTPSGKEEYEPLFNNISRIDQNTCIIEPGPYVGVLSLNDSNITLLPPKWLSGLENKHIHYMLVKSNPFSPKTTHIPESITNQTVSADGFFEPLYNIFANELLSALSKGLYRTYVKEEINSKQLKGSLNFSKQLLLHLKGKPLFATDQHNFTAINDVNSLFLKACKVIEAHTSNSATAMLIEQAISILPNQIVPLMNFNTVQPDRRGNHLRWVLQLAKLIVNRESLSYKGGSSELFSLLINLFDLFENYVSCELIARDSFFSREFQISLVDGSTVANTSWDSRRVFPDIVYLTNKKKLVLDTKFKKISSFGPEISDVYQLYFYVSMLGIDHGIIVYPTHKTTAEIKKFPISFNSNLTKFIVCYGLPIVGTEQEMTNSIDQLYDYCMNLI